MQINTSKHILFTLFLMIPLALSAQVGKIKYVSRTGDTTLVVLAGSTGLYGEDAAFLLDSKASKDYLDRHSRYKQLKDAVQETDQVADIVHVESKRTNPSSGSLGFRIAQQNIDYLRRDQDAQQIARKNINRGASTEELTYLYEKYGEMPSYFINGLPVEQKIVASLSDKDVLSKQLKVSNTTTGNPNGEVWHIVSQKTFNRLGLGSYSMPEDVHYAEKPTREPAYKPRQEVEQDYYYDEMPARNNAGVRSEQPNSALVRDDMKEKMREEMLSNMSPEKKQALSEQQRQVELLKKEIEALQQQRLGGGAKENSLANTASPTPIQQVTAPASTTYIPPATASSVSPTTRPLQQRKYTQPAEEIISFKDSPQEKARRERTQTGSMYGADSKLTEGQVSADENISEDTSKRSIRKIKERQRSQ